MAVFLGGIVSGDWEPFDLPNCIEWLWWIAAVSFVLGIGCVAWSIWPDTTDDATSSLPSYYQRIAAYRDSSSLSSAINDTDFDEILTEQLLAVSKIATEKYLKLRWGLGLLAIGCVIMAVVPIFAGLC